MAIKTVPQIERKDSLYVVRLAGVPVNYDRPLDQLIPIAGPQTSRESDIWKLVKKYSAPKRGIVPTNITLANFGRDWQSDEAVALGVSNRLFIADPWATLSVGETHPTLNRDLDKEYMGVVSLDKRTLDGIQRVPYLWFLESKRRANAFWFDDGWRDYDWFALLGEF